MTHRRVEVYWNAINFDYRIQYWEGGKIGHIHYTTKIDEIKISEFLRYGIKPCDHTK